MNHLKKIAVASVAILGSLIVSATSFADAQLCNALFGLNISETTIAGYITANNVIGVKTALSEALKSKVSVRAPEELLPLANIPFDVFQSADAEIKALMVLYGAYLKIPPHQQRMVVWFINDFEMHPDELPTPDSYYDYNYDYTDVPLQWFVLAHALAKQNLDKKTLKP